MERLAPFVISVRAVSGQAVKMPSAFRRDVVVN